jgi:hypothetical protein
MSAVTQKDSFNDDSDPPIIITGGGGAALRPAPNAISIDYREHSTGANRRARTAVNAHAIISGVTVVVTGTSAGTNRTQTLNFPFDFETYTVNVRFTTKASPVTPVRKTASKGGSKGGSKSGSKSGSKTTKGGKKATTKRVAKRKGR